MQLSLFLSLCLLHPDAQVRYSSPPCLRFERAGVGSKRTEGYLFSAKSTIFLWWRWMARQMLKLRPRASSCHWSCQSLEGKAQAHSPTDWGYWDAGLLGWRVGRAVGRDAYRWRDVDQLTIGSPCNCNSDLNLPTHSLTHSSSQRSTIRHSLTTLDHPPHDTASPLATTLIAQPVYTTCLQTSNQSIDPSVHQSIRPTAYRSGPLQLSAPKSFSVVHHLQPSLAALIRSRPIRPKKTGPRDPHHHFLTLRRCYNISVT